MAGPVEQIEFNEQDTSEVVAEMATMATAAAGWVNLAPEVERGAEVPPSGGLFSFLAARGPAVPLGTWSAGASGKRGPGRASIGVQHGSGPKALNRLAEVGLALPAGWSRVQDHPRRGLVVTVPADAAHDDVLHWLLSAMHALSAAPLSGEWLASVYRRA